MFEDLPLAGFGNIPQLSFEVMRCISADNPNALETRLGGIALIPGAGEFVYDTAIVSADDGAGATMPENVHIAAGNADITASLDALHALAPNIGAASLAVGWFGDCAPKKKASRCVAVPAARGRKGSPHVTLTSRRAPAFMRANRHWSAA